MLGNLFTYGLLAFGAYQLFVLGMQAYDLMNIEECERHSKSCISPLLDSDAKWDIEIYIATTPTMGQIKEKNRLLKVENHAMSDLHEEEIELSVKRFKLYRNRTVYAHIYVYPTGKTLKHKHKIMSVYALSHLARERANRTNLLSDDATMFSEVSSESKALYWRGNLTISLLNEYPHFERTKVPGLVRHMLPITNQGRNYLPIVYAETVSVLHKKCFPITASNETVTLHFTLRPISLPKFRLFRMVESQLGQMSQFGLSEEDLDDIKGLFTDTNPYLLAATLIVSVLHTVFSGLAMKNDVAYWKELENMEGVSMRASLFECISQFVIFAYLYDTDKVNRLVLVLLIGECILAVWKLRRIYFLLKNTEPNADDPDKYATDWLLTILIPPVILYSIYSFIYDEHKSMWSFLLQTAASTIYTLGFIRMTPQLFINYRLKSVRGLPWRSLIYRSFNTFVDDLFSFVIDMPLLHRLACFRDDIVFFVFIYQWYIYGSRKEEDQEKEEEPKKEK